MTEEKQKVSYSWNTEVYHEREYFAPDGTRYQLDHLSNQTHTYTYKYRDNNGERKKGSIDIEVRYDPHCFTHERKDGEVTPALSLDEFDDGSTKDRVFDHERYVISFQLVQSILYLSR
ncbi:hypothetical protein AB7Z84_23735, partial [Escherichia coli]